MSGDDRDEIRWLTYAELGQARGISTASATRLAFRRKWRRQVGNDKTARVAVPVGKDKPATGTIHDDRDEIMDGIRDDVLRLLSALEGAIVTGAKSWAEVGILLAPTRVGSIQPGCDRPG
jgi:hypothetical protein